jgi:CheY-like chemotaxis protein
MLKILIVDDDPLMQMLYKGAAVSAGYELLTAGNGIEALMVMAESPPDLIFMDVIMPVMDGLTALREMRKHDLKRCPVVIITGNLQEYEASQHEAKLAGAVGFMSKPFSPAQLLAEIPRYLPGANNAWHEAAVEKSRVNSTENNAWTKLMIKFGTKCEDKVF